MRQLSSAPGTYVLILQSTTTRRIRVGRLGLMQLHPGTYLYIGSAFGPGGLSARLRHHHGLAKHPHWHIDYLHRHARLTSILYCEGEWLEHQWAACISELPGATIALPRFGSSDCDCPTHLYCFADAPSLEALRNAFGGTIEIVC